jgi:hypothetical protein
VTADGVNGDILAPITYARSGIGGVDVVPKIDVKLKVTNPPANGDWMITGDGPGAMNFEPTVAQLQGDVLSATVTGTSRVPTEIDKQNFEITWSISAQGGAEGTWIELPNKTSNVTYITNIDLTNPVVHTVLDIGCRNAKGLTNPSEVARAIWYNQENGFYDPSPGVKRADGTEMKYWGPAASIPATPTTRPDFFSYAGLVKNADGRCNAWAELLVAVLATQGVTSTYTQVVPNATSAPPAFPIAEGIYVFEELDGQGTSGQEFKFDGHAVVTLELAGKHHILDPSYGISYTDRYWGAVLVSTAERDWEVQSVEWLIFTNGPTSTQVLNPQDADDCDFNPGPFTYTP